MGLGGVEGGARVRGGCWGSLRARVRLEGCF